ncbi:MAG: hypothetical protein J6B96_02110 [Agathobacter sp.]|nr:hypothetical protein [Agathobacter sp.]
MVTCPNCKKELADGTKFCIGCGTKLEEAPVVETATAEKKAPAFDVSKIADTIKNVPKKMWAIAGGILAAVVVVIVAVVVILGMAPRDKHVVYLKDGELYLSMLDGKEPIELTSKFASRELGQDSLEIWMARQYVKFSEDGKRVFYPEKCDRDSYSFDLYYRNTSGNAEGERIVKNITNYSITADGKTVFYVSDGTLYSHNLKEETEIEDDIQGFWVSEDAKRIVFLDQDYDLYQLKDGKEPEKIARAIELCHVNEDVSNVFYKDREGSLYVWKYGAEEAEKIDDSVYSMIIGYNNGGAYYVKMKTVTTTMADYIIDDYKDADAAIVKPVYPDYDSYSWPVAPDYPYSWDYATYEEYEAACAQYQLDYEKYQTDYDAMYAQYQNDIDQYYKDYDAWYAKSDRDYYRERFVNYQYDVSTLELYYYDGTESKLVVDNMDVSSHNNGQYSFLFDDMPPVLTFYVSEMVGESVKINISEISSLSTTNRLIKESLESNRRFAVASGTESNVFDRGLVRNLNIAEDGKHVYYSPSEDTGTGALYEISTDGSVSDAVEYDTEVGFVWGTLSNGKPVYFKDYDYEDAEGTLYIAKEKIEKDVHDIVVPVKGGEGIYLWTDSNGDEGNLCYYDGKDVKELQEDVSLFDCGVTEKGGFIGLVDYSYSKEEGKLYYFEGTKEGKEIDEDVITVITPYGYR